MSDAPAPIVQSIAEIGAESNSQIFAGHAGGDVIINARAGSRGSL